MKATIALTREQRKELERLLCVIESMTTVSEEIRSNWVQVFTLDVSGAYIEEG